MKLKASSHAYDRAKERLGWKSSVLERMMEKAFEEGLRHKDTKGRLRRYLDKMYLKYKSGNNMRIYGENLFIFENATLITIYRLDNGLIKTLKYHG